MSSENQLTVREAAEMTRAADAPRNMMDLILAVSMNPDLDEKKLQVILDMQIKMEDRQNKQRFQDAVQRVQADAPQFGKTKSITVKGQERSRYAPLEDIDDVLKPLLKREGLSWKITERGCAPNGDVTFALIVSGHGHEEEVVRTFPTDRAAQGQYGPIRSAIQDAGSTTSYATRYLLKDFFGLVESGSDRDGNDIERISDDQVRDVETALADSRPADVSDADHLAAFLQWAKADKIESIRRADYKKCMDAIAAKRKALKK